jgi:hypothetical protein
MLIINNIYLNVYDYNLLLMIEMNIKAFSIKIKEFFFFMTAHLMPHVLPYLYLSIKSKETRESVLFSFVSIY